jgi:G:T-mismatch repair DNA endonuclease (very short patch repair protein)
MKRFTQTEKEYILKYWGSKPRKEIAKDLNRSISSIQKIASAGHVQHKVYWTKTEVKILKKNYGKIPTKTLAGQLNKKLAYVVHKANELGITVQQYQKWSEKELDFLKKEYANYSHEELSKILNRTPGSIKRRALKLKLKRHNLYLNGSNLEKDFENLLKELKVKYKTQIGFWKYVVDFVVDEKFIIETYGTYWHCDPLIYIEGPKNETQKLKVRRDVERIKYLQTLGYIVIVIWENDFYQSRELIKQALCAVFSSNTKNYNRSKTVELLREKDNTVLNSTITQGVESV